MAPTSKNRAGQFSLRSLLAGLTWLALILAICVHYQQAAVKQRAALESLKAAGLLPGAPIGGRYPPQPTAAPPADGDGLTR